MASNMNNSLISPEMLKDLLKNNLPIGMKVLNENIDTFLSSDEYYGYFNVIVEFAFNTNNEELLHKLSRYPILHIRYLFMAYLIDFYPNDIDKIYDDITNYMTSVTYELDEQLTFIPELMDVNDICEIAVKLLVNNREDDYNKLKEFILKEYDKNSLAYELLSPAFIKENTYGFVTSRHVPEITEFKRKVFTRDGDILFNTSANSRYEIIFRYTHRISQELVDELTDKLRYYLENPYVNYNTLTNTEKDLMHIDRCGLSLLLEEWTEKYMDLSQSKEYGFIGRGTTSSCYRLGDYVIKLVKGKWSYEDIICPNLYLIAKNYDERYVRNKSGVVVGGLEVQQYLTENAKDVDPKYLEYFDAALSDLGYRRDDSLVNGTFGENAMLLHTYKDADCDDPDSLPDWFKKTPIVIIDRDMIYPKDKKMVKQLSSYCS